MSIAPRPDGSESAPDESAGGTPTPPGPTIGRRRFVRGTVAVAGGLAATGYVAPSLRALGVPTALAVSGDPKGNNGVGNGLDPQPPGNPPINDGLGTGPGNPGNRGG